MDESEDVRNRDYRRLFTNCHFWLGETEEPPLCQSVTAGGSSSLWLTTRLRMLRSRWAYPVGLVLACEQERRRAGGDSKAGRRAGPPAAPPPQGPLHPALDSWTQTWTPWSGGSGPPQPSNTAPARSVFNETSPYPPLSPQKRVPLAGNTSDQTCANPHTTFKSLPSPCDVWRGVSGASDSGLGALLRLAEGALRGRGGERRPFGAEINKKGGWLLFAKVRRNLHLARRQTENVSSKMAEAVADAAHAQLGLR